MMGRNTMLNTTTFSLDCLGYSMHFEPLVPENICRSKVRKSNYYHIYWSADCKIGGHGSFLHSLSISIEKDPESQLPLVGSGVN